MMTSAKRLALFACVAVLLGCASVVPMARTGAYLAGYAAATEYLAAEPALDVQQRLAMRQAYRALRIVADVPDADWNETASAVDRMAFALADITLRPHVRAAATAVLERVAARTGAETATVEDIRQILRDACRGVEDALNR